MGSGLQLFVTEGNGVRRTCVALEGRATVTLGRGKDRGIVLHDPRVSRHHVVLELHDEDVWMARDEGSVNGTFLNGVRLRSGALLRHGDLLELGDVRVRIADSDQGVPSEGAPPAVGDDVTSVKLAEAAAVLASTEPSFVTRRSALLGVVGNLPRDMPAPSCLPTVAMLLLELFEAQHLALFAPAANRGHRLSPVFSVPTEDAWNETLGLAELAAQTHTALASRRPVLLGSGAGASIRDTSRLVRHDSFTLAVPTGKHVLALVGSKAPPIDVREELALLLAFVFAAGDILALATEEAGECEPSLTDSGTVRILPALLVGIGRSAAP